MTKKYSLKIKATILIGTLAVTLLSVNSISALKNNPYLTLRFAQMQWQFLLLKTQSPADAAIKTDAAAVAVPVIMYHGINESSDRYSVLPEKFLNQMRSLKNAGWQTVTLGQLEKFMAGDTSLPEKSFLLAFEDGRKDSFYNADPVLHSLGFNAVMYVIPGVSLKEQDSFHLDKGELDIMSKSGRWEIETQGNSAHTAVTVDNSGTEGDFYANKQWLAGQDRLETDEEFVQRITADLEGSKSALEGALNRPATSLSYPYGSSGEAASNYPEAEGTVLSIAQDIYPYVLYQYWPRMADGFTGNYGGKGAKTIKRFNIESDWDAHRLLGALEASAGQKLPYIETYGQNRPSWISLSGDLSYASNTLVIAPQGGGASAYLDGGKTWQDYIFRTTLVSGFPGNTLSLLAHYIDDKNYMACEYRPDTVAVKSVVNGKSAVLDSIKVSRSYRYSDNSEFAIDISSSTVKCLLNGDQLLVSPTPQDNLRGGIGIKSWNLNDNNDPLVFTDISAQTREDYEATYSASVSGKEIIYTFLDEGKMDLADEMRRDIYTVDRYAPVTIKNITWSEDPYNEQYWRFMFYSLQPTRNLLAIWDKTGNTAYLSKLKAILNSYLDNGQDGPYAWDLHGTAFRTMVLVNTYKKMAQQGVLDTTLRSKLEASLVRHGKFLLQDENYEGSYNHGIDQSLALYLLAVNFPQLDKDSAWQSKSVERITDGLNTLVDDDGVLVENSPYYHYYTLDKYWQLYRYLTNNNLSLGKNNDALLKSKLKKMTNYGTYILEPDSTIPLLGASLEGKVTYRGSYAEMGAFDPAFLYAITQGTAGKKPAENNIYFPAAGQTIMRSGWGPQYYTYQNQAIFDVGAYRTDHSDLDALSFTLFGNGISLLPDSGLYTYEPGPYRDYFHGTRAHNTVVVDNQSQQSGEASGDPFNQFGIYANNMVTGPGYVYQTARHTLFPGVTHNRALVMLEGKTMIVIDRLYSQDDHTYEQMFHVFPGATLAESDGALVAKRGNTTMMTIRQLKPNNVTLTETIGSNDPVDGLCSSEYEKAVPCYSLAYRQKGTEAEYVTAVTIGSDKAANYELKDGKLIVHLGKNTYTITLNIESELTRNIQVDKAENDAQTLTGSLIDDFSNINEWSENGDQDGAIHTVMNDIDSPDGYMEINLPDNGALVEIKRPLKIDMTQNRLFYDISIANWPEGKQMEVQLSNNNWQNFATYNMESDIYPITFDGNWVKTNLSAGEKRKTILGNWYFDKDGFDWSRVDGIRFRFKSYGEQPVSVKLKKLESASLRDDPKLVIIFDDGWSSILEAADIMEKYGLKGNVGVISSAVGRKDYLTIDDLKLLQDSYGWNIVNHSSLHKAAVPYYYQTDNLTGLEHDVLNGIYFLEKNGINSASNWYIYPNGSTNKEIEKIIAKYYVYARSTLDVPEAYPFEDPYAVKVFSVYSDRVNAEDTINAVNDAIKYRQSLFLMFHKFSENDPDVYTEFSLADFEDIISHIADTGIKVYTLEEYDQSHGIGQSKTAITERKPEKLNITIAAE